jgi:hypothetical protein
MTRGLVDEVHTSICPLSAMNRHFRLTGPRGLWLPLPKLDAAILLDGYLLKRVHLALEATDFGSVSLVATNEERGRPKHDDCDASDDAILGRLAVLNARGLGSASGDARRFLSDLAAA